MARLLSETTERCRCGRCSTSATITKWDCGCTEVRIHNDRAPCSTCTNFSALRRHCGKPGRPTGGHR